MAKIQETNVVIKLSKLVKDQNTDNHVSLPEDMIENLEAIVQQLVGDDIVVEISAIS